MIRLLVLVIMVAGALQAAQRPNIVFIFSDDHAQRAIGAYPDSFVPTPNLDRLAASGMLFENSFVGNSICGPSRATILTGKHCHINGYTKNYAPFDPEQPMFTGMLQKSGYQMAMIGKWHLTRRPPVGFDYYDMVPDQGHYYNPAFINAKGRYQEQGYVTDIITDKAIEWMGTHKDDPFMIMVQHKAPHRAWMPNLKYLTLYDDITIPEPDNLFDDYKTRTKAAHEQDLEIDSDMTLTSDLKVWELTEKRGSLWAWGPGRMTPEQKSVWDAAYGPKNKAFMDAKLTGKALISWKYQRYIKDYLRCVASIDESVGRLLDYLKASGLEKNTIVIYASDQGFYLGEHGWFDKRFMYEESMRTPLIMSWPGVIKPGSRATEMVQNLDYAPTFLDIAGVDIPTDIQGLSLMPVMKGQAKDWRDALYYHYYEGKHNWHAVARHDGIRTQRHKLIHYYTNKEWELYDLDVDPHEMNNLYGQEQVSSITTRLQAKLESVRKHYRVPPYELGK